MVAHNSAATAHQRCLAVFLFAAFFFARPSLLPAQIPTPPTAGPETGSSTTTATASVTGIVIGSDGAVYEGASVTLAPSQLTTTTDTDGRFQFSSVPPGNYELPVSAQGFDPKKQSITLRAGEPLSLPDIVLQIEAITTDVRVTETSQEIATEEVHAEEHQRVFGVIPNFYVVYDRNAPPLTTRQKYDLAWRSSIDPFTFIGTGAEAGIQQATNSFSGYGQGAAGYGDRFGADFGDNLLGTYLGSAVFPSLFHQDPRYLVLGSGTIRHRTLYAIANAVICRGDNGNWQFNYSGILGSLIAAGVSNFYYPAVNRNGASLTFENFGIGLGASAVTNIIQEFIVRKLTPKAHRQNDTP